MKAALLLALPVLMCASGDYVEVFGEVRSRPCLLLACCGDTQAYSQALANEMACSGMCFTSHSSPARSPSWPTDGHCAEVQCHGCLDESLIGFKCK